jgi:protein gp37
MGEITKIAWCHSTFNPWTGCQHVSPGCDHCYAESLAERFNLVQWGPGQHRRRTSEDNWRNPLKWNKTAQARGERRRVFCASLADWLDNQVPHQWRADLLKLIEDTPALDWLLLTKRPQNARKLVPDYWWGQPTVWFGITAEDQANFKHRWPIAREIPAVVHFVSYEPALGPLDLCEAGPPYPDWVIFGGESGKDARSADVEWAERMIEQSRMLGVAPFVKQLGHRPVNGSGALRLRDRAKGGDPEEWPPQLRVRDWPVSAQQARSKGAVRAS